MDDELKNEHQEGEPEAVSGQKLAELEALLFLHGEPLAEKRIRELLELTPEDLAALVGELREELARHERGITLLAHDDKLQLATKPQFSKLLEAFVKEQLTEDLTPASLETLAIVAYFGPIARSRIEYQRGVNSIFILRNLLLRGLVERFPNPERPNTYLYDVSFEFLKHMGVSKKEDLPEFGKFQELLKNFETQDLNATSNENQPQ